MRFAPILFIFTSVQAKRKDQGDYQNVDVYPERFSGSVDFGHVYKNGRHMANIGPDLQDPRSIQHARELLKKFASNIPKIDKPKELPIFHSPRDELLEKERISPAIREEKKRPIKDSKHRNRRPQRVRNMTQPLQKPIEDQRKRKYPDYPVYTQQDSSDNIPRDIVPKDDLDHKQYFSKTGFNLVTAEKRDPVNWTTCEEFAKGAVFYPDDVINLQWVPFYIWAPYRFVTSILHTLAYPTKKLVKQYKEQFGPYLNMELDWEQPKLIMKESRDMLLIAGDRKGLFYGIPYIDLPSPTKNYKIKLTVIVIRMKILDPYLAMMYCNDNYATIMSISGTEPPSDEEKTAEAGILKFRGRGNPASRDLELEENKLKFEIEQKRRKEANKFLVVERPTDTLDPSMW